MIGLFSRETRAKIAIRPGEARIVLLAAAWFFFLLAGYFIMRPLREAMGLAAGEKNLPWLFVATLVAMILVNPLYGRIVSRLPRRRFIPIVYRFFVSNVLVFFVLQLTLRGDALTWLGRAFFVWLSVFNLFVVSIFWSFLAENFGSASAKRLYAWIAVGGTTGAICGSGVTLFASVALSASWRPGLLVLAAVLLELSVRAFQRLAAHIEDSGVVVTSGAPDAGLGGSALEGLHQVIRSPYLRRI